MMTTNAQGLYPLPITLTLLTPLCRKFINMHLHYLGIFKK